tara:strand:- start:251 stop:475 length:225 start_codon:yes stop_codon:yes gene_type:complete
MIKVTTQAILEALNEINANECATRNELHAWMGYPYGFDKVLEAAVLADDVITEVVHTRGGVRINYLPWTNAPIA